MKIPGEVKITLEDYEQLKSALQQGKKTNTRLKMKVKEVLNASKELASFFTFVAGKVENMDNLVSAFNQESDTCEILKTDDNKYKIKLNIEDETEKDWS